MRKDPLTNNHYYHVFNRSIAKYIIFNNNLDYLRMIELIDLFKYVDFTYKYSAFSELGDEFKFLYVKSLKLNSAKLVEIVSFSIMPTHIHLTLKQLVDDGISKYMARVLNSYSRHFNLRHQRKGPLWEGRFKAVIVETDEQLLHLTRYHHLNAVSAGIVKKPEDWPYSSYLEYIDDSKTDGICDFKDVIDMKPDEYKKFTNDQIDYQRKLAIIKHLIFDNYSG